MLAADASRGRTTATFMRVHAAELGKAAHASHGVVAKGRGRDAHTLATLAARIAERLDRLTHSGSNRMQQRRLAASLQRAAAQAERFGKRL